MKQTESAPWLLLIHQLPPQPAYLRVKIWRRLQAMGAVAVKGAVYALPHDDQTQEDFRWLVREIVGSGGEASLCEARFVDGLSDQQVRALFDAARDADYETIRKDAGALADDLGGAAGAAGREREAGRPPAPAAHPDRRHRLLRRERPRRRRGGAVRRWRPGSQSRSRMSAGRTA